MQVSTSESRDKLAYSMLGEAETLLNVVAPKAGFVPGDIDTPVAAAQQPVRNTDMSDIDEIFSIFKR